MCAPSEHWILATFIAASDWGCQDSQPVAGVKEPARQTLNCDPIPEVQPKEASDGGISTEWLKSQVEMNGASFESIVDRKKWSTAAAPSTTIVLGVARQKVKGPIAGSFESAFPFVLLVQPSGHRTAPAHLLGLTFSTDLHVLGEENRPLSIDVSPRDCCFNTAELF